MTEKIKNNGFIFLSLILLISLLSYIVLFPLSVFAQETPETEPSAPALQEFEDTLQSLEEPVTEVTEEDLSDISLKADFITYEVVNEEDLIIAKNGVFFKYQDIEINTEYLSINLTTNQLFASGKVIFIQEDSETQCEELAYNWDTKKTILSQVKGEITGEGIKGSLYYRGEKLENFPETVKITGGNFTTCDLEEPHYHIVATEMTIYPKDKIIARNISWYEGNIKIISLPYFLVFLDRKTQMPILPKIGQNSSDGWFVKANFNYYVNEESYGTFYFDWFEEKGIGIGAEHTLEIGKNKGNPGETSIYLYLLKNKKTDNFRITGEADYSQNFENDIDARINLDYTGIRNNSSDPFDNTLKSQFNLEKDGEKYNLDVVGKYTFKGEGFDDLDIDGKITLKHQYNISDTLKSNLTLVYTEDNPSDDEADLEFEPKLNLKFTGDGYTLNLLAEKRIDLDDDNYTGENISKIIDRMPEFTFNKQSETIGDTKISYDLEASIARFYEASTGTDSTRGEYIVNLKRQISFGDDITLTPSGTFRQDVYSSGEARYLVGGKLVLKAAYSPYVSSTVTYNYNKSEGPTPFNFDVISPLSSRINGNLSLTPTEKIKLDLSTNYNFVTDSFGSLVAKLEYTPEDDWKLNFNTSYDLNDMEWNKRINSQLDLQLTDAWRVKYKGAIDLEDFKLTNSVVGITRDLHCRELTINYKQSSKSIWVEFFIKAFPTEKITIGGN